jgi:hypothetical protein
VNDGTNWQPTPGGEVAYFQPGGGGGHRLCVPQAGDNTQLQVWHGGMVGWFLPGMWRAEWTTQHDRQINGLPAPSILGRVQLAGRLDPVQQATTTGQPPGIDWSNYVPHPFLGV